MLMISLLKFSVKTIAHCERRSDIVAYFLTYIKYDIFAKTFESPTTEFMKKETENIKREIIRQKILPLPKKRKNEEIPMHIPPIFLVFFKAKEEVLAILLAKSLFSR